jgi:hypothetical protein
MYIVTSKPKRISVNSGLLHFITISLVVVKTVQMAHKGSIKTPLNWVLRLQVSSKARPQHSEKLGMASHDFHD